MKALRISPDLALPVDAATQTILIVGKRGSGKSTTAARIVEQLLKANVPVAILDPVDSWWGLKASRDGAGQGHSVYVFGGRHADLPLEPGAGALIAEFLCEHRAPVVLSCKHMSGLERSRFTVDFAMTLFRKWAGGVLHLVLEEAHELAPQAPPKGEKAEEMLGAFKRLWKLGRSSGIGGTAITQRPASLHKDITTQSEILVVHRTIGPQDVEAVRQWIKYHHQGEEILPQLATLKTGEAFVWAPEFPEDSPIGLRRVRVLPRETFDSSSTPKHGEQRTEPSELAAVDLERLRSKMTATIERAKAEDPRELRKKIAEQAARIRALETAKPATAPAASKPREVPVLKDAQIKRLEALADRVVRAVVGVQSAAHDFDVRANEITAAIAAARKRTPELGNALAVGAGRIPGGTPAPARPAPVVHRAPVAARTAASGNGGSISGPERKILTALAQHGPKTKSRLAILTGYSADGGAFNNPLSALRSKGYISPAGNDPISITADGAATLGPYEPLPTGRALADWWMGRLSGPERKLLGALVDAYPRPLTKDELAERTGYVADGGAFNNPLSRLRSLELAEGRGEIRASEALFE